MSGKYVGRHTRPNGRSGLLKLAAAAAAVLLVGAVGVFALKSRPQQLPDSSSQPGTSAQPPVGDVSSSGLDRSTVSSGQPDPAGPAQPPDVSAGGFPESIPYDFSQPAPAREPVEDSYFDDAAFVGDSRTDGLMLYGGIKSGKNLTSNGLSVFKLAEKKALTIDGKKYTLLEALAMEEYGKVYLSLGVNELGYKDEKYFYEKYSEAVDEIRKLQPNAVIYIQNLIPLNEGQIEEYNGNKFELTNERLRVYNDLIRQVAEEKQVVLLDLYTEFVDENDELPREASRDGVHLVKESCQHWLEYLKTHTVDLDTLYPDGPPAVKPAGADISTENGSGQA
ncbi:MAG: hypothetical protein HFF52_04895 [Lawsonibacter sp.]|nr:hypothetical protein [Lawsonibacter sp.]